MKGLLLMLSLLLTSSTLYSQLHVDEDSDIGVGTDTTGVSRMLIKNSTNLNTLELNGVYNGVGGKYGVKNLIEDSDVNGSNVLHGFYNQITNKGAGNSYGGTVQIKADGTGVKKGFYAEVYENSSGTQTVTGVEALLKPASASTSYGMKSRLDAETSSTGTIYGVHVFIANSGSGVKRGVFSQAVGTGNHAGLFIGNLGYTGTFGLVSDRKLKKEIRDMKKGCLSQLCKLQPRRYKMKKSRVHSGSEEEEYGLVAQELEEYFPNLVQTMTIPSNEEGVSEEEFKTVNYIALIPILIQSLKEQQEEIVSLRDRINKLEGN